MLKVMSLSLSQPDYTIYEPGNNTDDAANTDEYYHAILKMSEKYVLTPH